MANEQPPSPRQADLLSLVLLRYSDRQPAPTYHELRTAMGIRSTNAVADHIRALRRKGYLEEADPRASRSLVPTAKARRWQRAQAPRVAVREVVDGQLRETGRGLRLDAWLVG